MEEKVLMSPNAALTDAQREKMEGSTGDGKISLKRMANVIITSVVGIVVNVILGIIKIIVGMASNSIAIISDAINNFSDSISSVVTIITMVIVGRGATKKHPFGFGRVEYFSSMIIAVLVLVTGGQFFIESVKKIIAPEESTYTTLGLVLLGVAIVAKIGLGLYTKASGKKNNSPNLEASGQDALSDAIITGVTLIAALVTKFSGIIIDGWVGAVVSIFVLKAGIEIVMDVISKLMGDRPEPELADEIMDFIKGTEGVEGAYDLILHNYGPNIYIGNVNIELDESISMRDAYKITHPLSIEIFNKYGVFFYFGFYSVNMQDEDVRNMRNAVTAKLLEDKDVLQIHAFYVDPIEKHMSFDAVLSFEVKETLLKSLELKKKVNELYPDFDVTVVPDRDFTLSK